jgi:hypothetical protein
MNDPLRRVARFENSQNVKMSLTLIPRRFENSRNVEMTTVRPTIFNWLGLMALGFV